MFKHYLVLSLSIATCFLGTQLTHAAQPQSVKNSIGFKLAREVGVTELNANKKGFIVSPLSLHLAMSMAYNGMAGRTASTMEEYLAQLTDISVSSVKTSSVSTEAADLIKKLNTKIEIPLMGGKKAKYVVGTYNGAWANHKQNLKYDFKPEYLNILNESYSAESSILNFDDVKSAKVLNNWAFEKTNKLIPQIIKAEQLKKLIWVLMNATYLEASWETPFEVLNKNDSPQFLLTNGKKISASMIYSKMKTRYTETNAYQAVELSFLGGTASMYIILPAEGVNLKEWNADENGLWSQDTWKNIFSNMAKIHQLPTVKLTMPKFSMAYSAEMLEGSALTKAMGLDFLFNNSANFTNMDAKGSEPSKVGIIKQDAKIELDEKGVKAAAVTLIGGTSRGAIQPPPVVVEMIVNRPYAFAIYDQPTDSFLFVGAVMNPQ